MQIKTLFFDRPRVLRAVKRANRQNLARAGAFIRVAARSSIRKRKTVSLPGNPPHAHEGSLKRLILFGYDEAAESVVIGPVAFKRGEAPHLLEFGGSVFARKGRLVRVTGRGRDRRGRYTKARHKRLATGTRLTYAPRPFMGPALEQERPQLPKLWANSVRG